jgi:hypothetical protein
MRWGGKGGKGGAPLAETQTCTVDGLVYHWHGHARCELAVAVAAHEARADPQQDWLTLRLIVLGCMVALVSGRCPAAGRTVTVADPAGPATVDSDASPKLETQTMSVKVRRRVGRAGARWVFEGRAEVRAAAASRLC